MRFENAAKPLLLPDADDYPTSLAVQLAQRGYVVASIDYRLTGPFWGLESDRPPLDAVEDTRAAIRFLRKSAGQARIDTRRIGLAGDSAGACTSLFVGFAKVAQYEGSSGNPGYSSAINVSVPVSGELKSEAFCKSVDPAPAGCQLVHNATVGYDFTGDIGTFPGQPPVLLVHGTADLTVPYVNGEAAFKRATAAKIPAKLVTIPGAGHVPYEQLLDAKNPYFDQLLRFVADALDAKSAECPRRG